MKKLIFDSIKKHPTVTVGFLGGAFIGSFFAKIVFWIPLIGGLLSFFVNLAFAFAGVYLALHFKSKLSHQL